MAENKDPAFLFYSSDFLVGVSDLTMEERGQYITLLCLQHTKGHLSKKNILVGVGQVSDDVLAKFSIDDNGCYYNERLEKEVNKRKAYSESRKKNGAKKWEKEKHMQTENDAYASAYGYAYDMHTENVNRNIIDNINTNIDIVNKTNYDDIFDIFWNAYPKKIGKAYAKKCFEKLKPNAELVDRMVSAINEQKQTDSWKEAKGKYIPNPSTWLNQQRWDDVVEVETVQPKYKNIGVIL
jgi:hypothetical protein